MARIYAIYVDVISLVFYACRCHRPSRHQVVITVLDAVAHFAIRLAQLLNALNKFATLSTRQKPSRSVVRLRNQDCSRGICS
jgi:hypothetical protein